MGKIKARELKELFIEIKYGNRIAFEKLYNNYNKLIYNIAYSILKNKRDAEDIVQIVFEKLYLIDKEKLPNRNESSWLYSITKNETINYLKRNKNNIDLDSIYNIEDDNNEINKIILDSFDMIKIGVAKNQALFEMENCKIVTRLLDGEFLNYSSVIPENWETRIRVNKSILQDCFERVSLISSSSIEKEKKYPVRVSVDIGKVTISCTNQTGDAKEEIYLNTEGKNLEAGFNPKYFLDALRNIDDEEIFVNFGTSISPCIIRPVDEDGDYTYMILPIKLKD